MLRTTFAAALIAAALFIGCSGHQTLDREELKTAATEIVSIAAEGELLATAAAENHTPANYEKGHPEYLRKEAEEVAKDLQHGQPELDSRNECDRLRLAATRLIETLNALPASDSDPRWEQSRAQLDNLRREAEAIRRTF